MTGVVTVLCGQCVSDDTFCCPIYSLLVLHYDTVKALAITTALRYHLFDYNTLPGTAVRPTLYLCLALLAHSYSLKEVTLFLLVMEIVVVIILFAVGGDDD